jgi:hypothetical protein
VLTRADLLGPRILVVEGNLFLAETICGVLRENGCEMPGPRLGFRHHWRWLPMARSTERFSTSASRVNSPIRSPDASGDPCLYASRNHACAAAGAIVRLRTEAVRPLTNSTDSTKVKCMCRLIATAAQSAAAICISPPAAAADIFSLLGRQRSGSDGAPDAGSVATAFNA